MDTVVTRALLLIFACGVAVAGCRDNPPVVYPTVAPLDTSKLPLGPGDKISVVVYYGDKQDRSEYIIDESGEIQLRHIGVVTASGKTAKVLRDEIQTQLADGYLVNPIVNISIAEINSQKLLVFGQVA